jgi:hypothetical protein
MKTQLHNSQISPSTHQALAGRTRRYKLSKYDLPLHSIVVPTWPH